MRGRSSTGPVQAHGQAPIGCVQAMEAYERAEALRPADNDDALLRWNACARVFNSQPALLTAVEDEAPSAIMSE